MVDLLKHNQEAFQEISKMIESETKRITIPRATGSGKTYLMGALAEKYNDVSKLVLEPTRPLLNSIKEKFDEFEITNTDFMTYQKLIRMSDEDIAAMDYKLIFLDECHHGTAPVWGKKIDCLMETHNMLNEGLHISDISGVLMLRTTQSNLIYLQQLGRLVESGNMDKYLLVFDFVNNFSSVNDGIGLLREIKDAIAKEKENDPDFDDSGFEDIDTFFVVEQIVEIQEMFREIEGRLEGDWDVMFQEFCKFYEENGHGDVPKTKQYRKLNTWCKNQRSNLDNGVLQAERKQLLDESNFIWDVLKYRFEKNVFDCIAFYKKKGRLPSVCSENKEERELMGRIYNYKGYMSNYPQWKQGLLKMIPDLFDEKVSRFDKFYNMALIYKQKYGHVSIENNDVIGEYKIGRIYNLLVYDYKIGKLTDEQVRKLSSLGIDITVGKSKKRYDDKIQLAQQALSEGIVLSRKNRIYKGVDLYKWYYSHKSSLSKEQLNTFKKIICKHEKTIKVVDLLNKQTNIYSSITKVAEVLYSEFNVTKNDKSAMYSILHHLSGKVTTPYKGRFMFYYATDEEVEKYLEDNKVS